MKAEGLLATAAGMSVSAASLWLTDAHKEDLNFLTQFPNAGACLPAPILQ